MRNKNITELERRDFGDPKDAPTPMVKRCLELCRVPIDDFTPEDLRLMIGQAFSLQYLVPMAIEHLQKDILTEGDLYPGDLLSAMLNIDPVFWLDNKELWFEVMELIENGRENLALGGIDTKAFEALY